MPQANEPLINPGDVSTQFYRALSTGDLELMMACWADEDDVSCVAPGGEMLRGLAAIRALFADLFQRGPVRMHVHDVHEVNAVMHAVHTLVEEVEISAEGQTATAQVFATNVFVKTPQGWRLQAHHASPGLVTAERSNQPVQAPPTLH